NEQMETPLEGLFVAGNITGIESAKVARAQGALAGLSIVRQTAKNATNIDFKIREAKRNVKTTREEASIQFHPGINEGREKVEKVLQEYEQVTLMLMDTSCIMQEVFFVGHARRLHFPVPDLP